MRFKEFISESVKKAEVDWQQWKAAMAASAVQRNVPRGIDAIVYLGIIGDPNSNSNLDIRFKRLVQIGMDVSPKGQGYIQPGAAAQYSPGTYNYDDPQSIDGQNRKQVGRDFDILFDFQGEPLERQDWAQFQNALSNTVAHELMHRGFEIIKHIPQINNQIPEPAKSYFNQRFSNNIPGLYNANTLDGSKDFQPASVHQSYLEHMMIYSMLHENWRYSSGNTAEYAAQVQKFRKIYMDIESAAQQYILSYPIPPGSLAALRSEIDGKTPSNVDVTVKIAANDKPTVILTTPTANQPEKPLVPPADPVSPQNNTIAAKKMSMNDVLRKGAHAVGDAVEKGAKSVGDTLAIGYHNLLDKISPKKDVKETTNSELDRISQLSGIKKRDQL